MRRSSLAKKVKSIYDCQCQVCGTRLETAGGAYAEGAHIKPVGSPHDGPDVLSNLLCLCANCHSRFDKGGFVINDDLIIEDLVGGELHGLVLRVDKRHKPAPAAEFFAYHRSLWVDSDLP